MFFRPSTGKIISPLAVDTSDFADKVGSALEAGNIRLWPEGRISMAVRGKILPIGYNVVFQLRHRRIRYSFGTENIFLALIVAVFGGMLLYKGRLDTYIFWALALSSVTYWISNVLIHGRISAAIKSVLPSPDIQDDNLRRQDTRCSITYQRICPACGKSLSDFGTACPECGITLRSSRESSSRLPGVQLKYFYKKNTKKS